MSLDSGEDVRPRGGEGRARGSNGGERKGKRGFIRQHIYVAVDGLDTHYKCELCGYLRALNAKKRAKLGKKRGWGEVEAKTARNGPISAKPPNPPAKVARRLRKEPSKQPFTAQQAFGPLASGKCCYCDAWRVLTVEHITARARGGAYQQRNTLYSCSPCNTEKGTMSLEEWVTAMPTDDTRRLRVQYFVHQQARWEVEEQATRSEIRETTGSAQQIGKSKSKAPGGDNAGMALQKELASKSQSSRRALIAGDHGE